MARVTIRIDFGAGAALGPGKARLLELIGELGSIRRAAAAMTMSYRQAWLLVKALEETFGGPVVTTARGGPRGGGAALTLLGRKLIARYRAVERKAADAVEADVGALAKLAAPPRAARHRPLRPRKGRAGKTRG
jgi:molybdate transport system regulatory protein